MFQTVATSCLIVYYDSVQCCLLSVFCMKKDSKDKGNGSGGKNPSEAVFDEFLNDVENDMKLENYKRLWDKYGKIISSVSIVVIASAVVLNFWFRYEENKKEEFAVQFAAAQNLINSEKSEEGLSMLNFLIGSANFEYSTLARFAKAGLLAKMDFAKNFDEIKGLYKSIFENKKNPQYMREYATIAYVNSEVDRPDQKEFDASELLKLLEETCSKNKSGFYWMATELKAMLYYQNKEYEKARECCDMITETKEAPPSMKRRIIILMQRVQGRKNK